MLLDTFAVHHALDEHVPVKDGRYHFVGRIKYVDKPIPRPTLTMRTYVHGQNDSLKIAAANLQAVVST